MKDDVQHNLDQMVKAGLLKRVTGENGEPKYILAVRDKKEFDRLLSEFEKTNGS